MAIESALAEGLQEKNAFGSRQFGWFQYAFIFQICSSSGSPKMSAARGLGA
jgi:hypothetical protein